MLDQVVSRTIENAVAELVDRLVGRNVDLHKRLIVEAAIKESLKAIPSEVDDVTLWEIEQRLISVFSMVEHRQTKRQCPEGTPRGFAGHWKEWHRGHGCNRDDGRSRSPAVKVDRCDDCDPSFTTCFNNIRACVKARK